MMRYTLSCCLVVAWVLLLSDTKVAAEESKVVRLTSETFHDSVLDSKKNYFVRFFTPWCRQCSEMEEDWISLANIIDEEADNTVIADVNLEESRDIAWDQDIQGLPSIRLYPAKPADIPHPSISKSKAALEEEKLEEADLAPADGENAAEAGDTADEVIPPEVVPQEQELAEVLDDPTVPIDVKRRLTEYVVYDEGHDLTSMNNWLHRNKL